MAAQPAESADKSGFIGKIERLSKTRQSKALSRSTNTHVIDEVVQQLPLWREEYRGLPNALARSALFSAQHGAGTRPRLDRQEITALSNIRVVYTGESLYQDDASVFMQLLHEARMHPLGDRVQFSGYAMLRALRWSVGGEGYARLSRCIERLKANMVRITMDNGKNGRITYGSSLILHFKAAEQLGEDENSPNYSKWEVQLDPAISTLFDSRGYSLIEKAQRDQINSRASLTLWMHSFLSTHRHPLPISVERYHELSGSPIKTTYHFKRKLQDALDRLVEIGFLIDYNVSSGNLVHVTRNTFSILGTTPDDEPPEALLKLG